jgi:hypothetical protein
MNFISNVPFGFRNTKTEVYTTAHYTDMKLAVIEPLVFSKICNH